jgi:predicted NAD-dependent protein-ADP-ribosyltransferase YbiA (DUF1768 family)
MTDPKETTQETTIITRTSVLGLWHASPMRWDNQQFYHVEGWLQYGKHVHANPSFAREIARTKSASQARDMGDERLLWADLDLGKRALRVDEIEEWHERRPQALRQGLWIRVRHDPAVRRELLATGDTHIRYVDESAAWYETHMGEELMRIRDAVRNSPPPPHEEPRREQPRPPRPPHPAWRRGRH